MSSPSPSASRADRAKAKSSAGSRRNPNKFRSNDRVTQSDDSDVAETRPAGSNPGPPKAKKPRAEKSSDKVIATWNGRYKFAATHQGMTDADIAAKFSSSHPVWQDGQAEIPRPRWMDHQYGPLPVDDKIKIQPPTGQKKNPDSEHEIKARMTADWKTSDVHVSGARNMYVWTLGNVSAAYIIPYLGFPNTATLSSFVLTEGLTISVSVYLSLNLLLPHAAPSARWPS